MDKRKKLFIIIGIIVVLVIAAIIIIFSAKNDSTKEEPTKPAATTEALTTTQEATEETTTIKYVDPVIDFNELQSVNKDCFAYIRVPDTPVDYPVLRSSDQDDDYYLNVTFEGASGYPGSLYTQQITKADFSSYISVIYGHDMADGSFFGSLKNYIDKDYFSKHQQMFIYTPKMQFEYKIVAEVTVNDDNISYLFDPERKGSSKLFWDYIQNGEEENTFDETYKFKSGDKFAILATCIGWRPTDRRIVVGVLTETSHVR